MSFFKRALLKNFSVVLFLFPFFSGAQAQTIWKLTDTLLVGGQQPTVLGRPQIVAGAKNTTSLFFDGVDDGLVVPVNPVAGRKAFTVEVLFRPDGDGPTAPRMLHWEDAEGNRGTIEGRLTPDRQWYLDAFLKNGKLNKGLTLIDSTKLHPTDQWVWAAMVYDGKTMRSYINGKQELEGMVDIPVMGSGNIAIGVRLNKVNWFKGQIGEVRFHPKALKRKRLQRVGN
ncbi:LamG domain-containing protein [Paraflavisolibacter sp. H34]|uniref:LamG domain-containing protein n=1 Tax=Huijunlia imazamoxiresistens TaxID=3127457 RepID=UPI0030199302